MSRLNYENSIVRDAQMFARGAHCGIGQKRKWSGDDYITHPRRVVERLMSWEARVPVTLEMLAAAWLHDVLEDTCITPEQLHNTFPLSVVGLVVQLTNMRPTGPDFYVDRAERKQADLERLATVSPQAQTIKYADIWDNVDSFMKDDIKFAREVYIPEKVLLVTAMNKGSAHLRSKLLAYLNNP